MLLTRIPMNSVVCARRFGRKPLGKLNQILQEGIRQLPSSEPLWISLSSAMVVSVGRTAGFCLGIQSMGRISAQQRAFAAACVSAGLKPLTALFLTTPTSSPASNVSGRIFSRGGFHSSATGSSRSYAGDSGWSSPPLPPLPEVLRRMTNTAAQAAYDQYGQDNRVSFPRPPQIQWEKDLANAVQLIGNVGRDIDLRYLDTGKVLARTSLAVKKGVQRTEEPSWFELEIWDALAEIVAHHVKKGEQIFVTGRIVVDKWAKDEVQYTTAKVVVRDLCFVEPYSGQRQAYGQSNVVQSEWDMGSASRSQESATAGTSQKNWNQQVVPQEQKVAPSSYEDAALATEKRWQEYFADPTQWWDNRTNKRNPKSPDFKHKSTQEALWIGSWSNPPWVAQQLAVLQEKQALSGDSQNRSQDKKLSSFKDSDFLY